MKKKILVYKWGSVCEPMFCGALGELNREYIEFSMEMKNYHADAAFAQAFIQTIHKEPVEAVFSYDYFPLISMICEMNQIPYLSWIYDCPQYTLLSKTLSNSCNYIFCFDRVYAEYLAGLGARNCFHYPLAGDVDWYERASEQCEKRDAKVQAASTEADSIAVSEEEGVVAKALVESLYTCDISFVGNLYNGEKNRFRQAELSPYTAGVVEGIIESQLLIYGTNFVAEALPAAVVEEIAEACKLSLGAEYYFDVRGMAADVLNMEVSARERELVLNVLGETHKVRLYTGSELPDSLADKQIEVRGYADYQSEVPLIFHNSKINLNITSQTITSGIPQRIFDILSCRGFCLTNYQPEVAECFSDGEELVMYTDMADLADKVNYYLEHEEERKRIAKNGYRKVKEEFGLTERVEGMLRVLEGRSVLKV